MTSYSEPFDAGNAHRIAYMEDTHRLIQHRFNEATAKRDAFFQPDLSSVEAYEASMEPHRHRFETMLGWPLTEFDIASPLTVEREEVAEDELGRISRMWVEALPDWRMYGLLFEPSNDSEACDGRKPLVIAQHGGLGTPELAANFHRESNYTDFPRRVLRRGAIVFMPQVMLWAHDFGPCTIDDYPEGKNIGESPRTGMDAMLRALGGSIVALEIFGIQRCLDALLQREDVDTERVGMMGLSWGGFYTLYTAAIDMRIKVAVNSCMMHDGRKLTKFVTQSWPNIADRYLMAEVAAMVCPRRLYIELGAKDETITLGPGRAESMRARRYWEQLGILDRFGYKEFNGGHKVDEADDGIDFLFAGLNAEA